LSALRRLLVANVAEMMFDGSGTTTGLNGKLQSDGVSGYQLIGRERGTFV